MNMITAYSNLTKSLFQNNCAVVKENLKIFEDLCVKEQLYFSNEICKMMTLPFEQTSQPAWKILLDVCSQQIDMDDFSSQVAYMANQKKWWLIEEVLNHGVDLDMSKPNIFCSLVACAPLQMVEQSLDQQQNISVADAVLSVNNPDPRVFEFFMDMFSVQTIQETLQSTPKSVKVDNVWFSILEQPWVTSAMEKKSIQDNLNINPHTSQPRKM